MINCAIYPRKSNAVDNSDSMETQIAMCQDYIHRIYGDNCTISVYDGDYGVTGHSIKKRFDFQRMMTDIKAGKVQLVVIQRFDRIARNMRDFCNLYHDMEEAGCNLVSVSQQIDTSTPYGKNFMYQMAGMAELEWSLTSERIKDSNKYAVTHGKCRLSNKQIPFGYTTRRVDGIRKMVIDPEKEPIIRDLYNKYIECRNGNETIRYINTKYNLNFCHDAIYRIAKNPFYHGEYRGNKNYCEAYFTEEEQNEFIKKNLCTRAIPNKRGDSLFAGLVICPVCGRKLESKGWQNGKNYLRYMRCRYVRVSTCDFRLSKSELKIESFLVENIDKYINQYNSEITNGRKKSDYTKEISSVDKELERLNTMYLKGRISEEKYDAEYLSLTEKKALYETKMNENKQIKEFDALMVDNWKEMYYALDSSGRKRFWREIISEIIIDDSFEITDIIFL